MNSGWREPRDRWARLRPKQPDGPVRGEAGRNQTPSCAAVNRCRSDWYQSGSGRLSAFTFVRASANEDLFGLDPVMDGGRLAQLLRLRTRTLAFHRPRSSRSPPTIALWMESLPAAT